VDHEPGVSTTVRVDRPDGTAVEVVRSDRGEITHTVYAPDGAIQERTVAGFGETGEVAVVRSGGSGEDLRPAAPVSVAASSNPYGLVVERSEYGDGLLIEESFDDEARLRRVTVRGPWGSQVLAVRADGSRSLSWDTALHRGTQCWDAAGRRSSYEVTFSDGTTWVPPSAL
jgi:hypothetical protein